MVDAATLRLRPILMTTGAMVLGALPLALATGAGAESRTQIGWVIVGGMTFGTLLTLFVVPTAYTLLAGRAAAQRRSAARAAGTRTARLAPRRRGRASDDPTPRATVGGTDSAAASAGSRTTAPHLQ